MDLCISAYKTTTPSYEVVVKHPPTKILATTPDYESLDSLDSFEDYDYLENDYSSDYEYSTTTEDPTPPPTEASYNSFLSFIQMVQEKLLQSTSKENKLGILTNLRDILLSSLYTHISQLWKTKTRTKRGSTEPKGYKDDSEMDFPSYEGALMTISFLTFAVTLIKLVIKLVQALKYKYMNTVTTTTTIAPTVFILKRKKREEFDDKTARILSYIDKYPYY